MTKPVEMRRRLHLLKGSSATIGAHALSGACRSLETDLTGGQAGPGLAQLRGLARETMAARRSELLHAESPLAIY